LNGLSKASSVALYTLLLLLLLSVGGANAFHVDAQTTNTSISSTVTGISIPLAIDPVNPAAIPLGDGNISTTPKVGYVDSCQTTFPSNQGAQVVGPWIDTASKTWNSETKVTVQGSVSWPDASFSVTISGDERIITGNDEPIDHTTGVFPISPSDPAYQYDENPNHIAPQNVDMVLPVTPTLAASPTCLVGGPIGILDDGVYLYDALDAQGRDAGAHEVLDSCSGHPDQSDTYHHHDVPPCILDNDTAPDSSTLVGYARDGFGIYVERDANGNLLTNANLDACHGRTSEVMWDGQLVDMYHYDATLEYPYTVGCYMGVVGTPTSTTGTTTSTSAPSTSTSVISSVTSTNFTSTPSTSLSTSIISSASSTSFSSTFGRSTISSSTATSSSSISLSSSSASTTAIQSSGSGTLSTTPSSTGTATSSTGAPSATSLDPSYLLAVAPALVVIILLFLGVQPVVRRIRPTGKGPTKPG
jgi:hypothetical protein